MNIRNLKVTDLEDIQKIHEKHFKAEFDFPDFFSQFLCGFVVEDDSGIITAGGIRTIVELVFVTDKDKTHRERRTALYKGLDVCQFTAKGYGYDQLHAFIQDEQWLQVMESRGFIPCKGKAIYIGVD